MSIVKKHFILLIVIFFIGCKKEDTINNNTSIPENIKENKHWRVQINVPVNSNDKLRFLNAKVVNKNYIFFTSEDSDHNAYMHKSTNGGVNWSKKWAKTNFRLDHFVSKKGKGWYNDESFGLRYLSPSVKLTKIGTPSEKVAKISKIAYVNDEATEGIFICSDKSVHKIKIDVNIKKTKNDQKDEEVNRVTSIKALYKESDPTYSPYSPTSKIQTTTHLDENNIWGGGYVKIGNEKKPLVIFKNENNGEWVEKDFEIPGKPQAQISKLTFIDSNNGYAIIRNTPNGYGGDPFYFNLIYKTNDGGNTWTPVSNPNPSSVEINSITIENKNVGYFTAQNIIYRTTNGGKNWEIFYDKTPVSQVVFKDGILFGFSSGLILKYY